MKQETPSAPSVIEMTPTSGALYPELSGQGAPPDQSYRLQEISRLRKHLEEKRTQLEKKYRRAANILNGCDTALLLISALTGVGGVGLLSTIVAAPVVIGLEATSLLCGVVGAAGKILGRRLAVKVKKHCEIRVLATSKLNTISDHVSRALMDGVISDDEFKLIVEELQKYDQLKAEIRAGSRKKTGRHTGRGDEERACPARSRRGPSHLYEEIGCSVVFFKRPRPPPWSP